MGKSFFRWMAGLIFAAVLAVPPALAQSEAYSQQQLESMLAPIALYPDELLSQVLIAATYPDDVTDAADFLDRYPDLSGNGLADAVGGQPWDDSVKALTQFPSVIAMLDEQPEWADAIGYAFVYQQGDVMTAVQRLRANARDAGTLLSNEQQRVIVQNNYVYIEPARPGYFYVPYYDPMVVYGSWRYPDYPPYYWAPPPRYRPPQYSVASGIFFGVGVGIVSSIFRPARPDWRHHHVVIGGRGRPGSVWHYKPRPNRPGVRPPTNRPHRPGLPSKPPAWKPPAHRPPSQGVRPQRPGRPGSPSVRPPAAVQPGRPAQPQRPGANRPVQPQRPGVNRPGQPQRPSRPGMNRPERPVPPAANKPGTKPAPNRPVRPETRPPATVNPKPVSPRPENGARPTPPANRPSPSTRPSSRPVPQTGPQTRPAGPLQSRPVMPPQAKPQAPAQQPGQARPQRSPQAAPSRPAVRPEGRGQERRNDNGKREKRGDQP
jgi:hypothetical protein